MKPTNKETIKPIMQFALSVLTVRRNQTERANKRIAKASHSRCSVLAAQQPSKKP